jgi:hypothetical protein
MARLRLLFALFLMSLGTWFGALALSGYYEPSITMQAAPTVSPVGLEASADTEQFISLLTRERFVAVETPAAVAAPAKPKPAKAAVKTKPPAVEKRLQQTAGQLPWPLSLFSN